MLLQREIGNGLNFCPVAVQQAGIVPARERAIEVLRDRSGIRTARYLMVGLRLFN